MFFWGVLFFSSRVSSQFAAQVTMTFNKNVGGRKTLPTMYIFCLCISKTMHSVQTKLLGAWARLQECVPDFFLFPILQFDKNCLPSTPDV